MKRYSLFRRNGVFYVEDRLEDKQGSLGTRDKTDKNRVMNLQMARVATTCLRGDADSASQRRIREDGLGRVGGERPLRDGGLYPNKSMNPEIRLAILPRTEPASVPVLVWASPADATPDQMTVVPILK